MSYNAFILHSAATGDANGKSIECESFSVMSVQITGTFTATVYFEGTLGSTWVSLEAINVASGAKATSATAAGVYRMGIGGLKYARARLDWTSGTSITVLAGVSDAPDAMIQDVALAANSGVDIGDVDVLTVPGAIQGPGNPTIDSYSTAVVNLAASTADQVLVSSATNKQIWVYGLFMMADTAAGTVTLQDEDNTPLSGTMAVSDEGGWVLPMSGNFAMPWIKCATNKDLEADTGACTIDGIITYAIVSV